jgi:hypothetical protein
MRFISTISILFFSCGPENEINEIIKKDDTSPQLVVEPLFVDFGTVQPNQEVTDVVVFRNDGDKAVDIQDVRLEGSSFTAVSSAPIGMLLPSESVEMMISYTPINLEDTGWLKVSSDDPAAQIVYVELAGSGSIPLLTIDPPQLDMGWLDIDETAQDGFTLRNEGMASLTVTESILVGESFSIVDVDISVLPATLDPGEEMFLDVAFSPRTLGDHVGTLWVQSDTPAGTTQASVIGACAPKPIAVCEVTPEEIEPHSEAATWLGEDSYDPSGATIVEYEWTLLQKPLGSTSFIPNGGANRPNFSPDLAGEYIGRLVVYNDWGRASEPCETTLYAVPKESLWVELFWEYSGDDMDLHILRPGGAMETNGDCYYMNCVSGGWLDWGVLNYSDDDPSLDLDDIPGVGPENTNILDPEAGTFQVWVHDYPGSIFHNANEVTVKIYLSGTLAWEGTKTITGENSYVPFADIIWPDGIVVPK